MLYTIGHPLTRFFEGDCPIFAVALHRLTGLPLAGLTEFDSEHNKTMLIHAYVKVNATEIIDAVGESTVNEVLTEFPYVDTPHEAYFTEQELLTLGYGTTTPPALATVLPIAQDVLDAIGFQAPTATSPTP